MTPLELEARILEELNRRVYRHLQDNDIPDLSSFALGGMETAKIAAEIVEGLIKQKEAE